MSVRKTMLPAFLTILALAWSATVFAQAANYSEGQKVEVREGDTWSTATILKREGRRYQIRYADDPNSDEWVTADRLRLPGAAPAAGAGNAANPATKPAPPKPAAPAWVNGQKVEVKWGGSYFESTIVNRRGDWYLIEYARHNGQREWVEPWRIRKVGSTEDNVGHARPNPVVRNNAGPPREKPGDPPEAPGARRDEQAKSPLVDDPAYKEVDAADAKEIDLRIAAKPVADPSAQPAIPEKSIALKGAIQTAFPTIDATIIPRGKSTWAYLSHTGHGSDAPANLERVDFTSGSSAAVFEMGSNVQLLDISPDGTQAAYRSTGFGAGKSNFLLIYKLEGAQPKRSLIFMPYGVQWPACDIEQALFVDNDHILTLNRERMLLWKLSTAKAVWGTAIDMSCRAALSPGGKYVAVTSKGRVLVMDAMTGALAANLEAPTSHGVSVAFSPSGKQLVAYSGSIVAWDLGTGQVTSEFTLPKGGGGGSLQVPADGYALMGGATLLDLQRSLPLWSYRGHAGGVVAPTGQYCYTVIDTFNKTAALRVTKLPHAAAVAAAKEIRPDEAMLLMPGTKVSVQVNTGEAGVEDSLKQQIANAGLVVADDAPARFIATIEQGKSEEREYRPLGRFGASEKVTVTQMISKVTLEHDGKVAWESSSVTGAGFFLNMKQGQTIQDAVAEASKPNVKFFGTVRIPRYLPKPREAYGTSTLTAQGIK